MEGDKLLLPDVYEKTEILDNGPLRFTVRQEMYEQNGVRETRLISQDKGTHLAKIKVDYVLSTSSSQLPSLRLCAGIAVHESQPSTYTINKKANYITYADALDTPKGQNGQLFIAVLFPQKMKALKYFSLPEKKSGAVGHVLGISDAKWQMSNDKMVNGMSYYFGTGWSKYDVPTQQVWDTLLQGYARNLAQPLQVELK